ncbi:hypothetical protein PPS11_45662, partial [Pseudomonas putida S11]
MAPASAVPLISVPLLGSIVGLAWGYGINRGADLWGAGVAGGVLSHGIDHRAVGKRSRRCESPVTAAVGG